MTLRWKLAGSAAGFALLAALPAFAQDAALVRKTAQANFQEFFEMLSMPNDAIVAEDIRKNAAWLETAFQKRGFATKQLTNNGKPMVFAEYNRHLEGAKTVLFYIHFDGQPVVDTQWAQKSPWNAVLKQRNAAGKWEEIDRGKLLSGEIDPEWRLFARSASDDKGPIMMFLTAFDAMKAAGAAPAVNVKVLLDSEEEKESVGLAATTAQNRALLKSDVMVINDGPLHESGLPTVAFGNRGVMPVRLTVYGPKSNLHSGHYGNYAPNPALRLSALLAGMKDEEGRVTIPGYYDGVKLTEADKQVLAAVPDDEAALKKRLGIAKPDAVGSNYQEALQYPSLNIRGMAAASVGEKAANIVPAFAVAELDLRTVPGASPSDLFDAVEKHVRSKGYHLTKGEPSEDERAQYDRLASLVPAHGSRAEITSVDSPLGKWVQKALSETFARDGKPAETVRIRMMGGSVPTDILLDSLGDVPFVLVPLVNNDNNQHSFDENLRIGNFFSGTRSFIGMLKTPL